MADEEEIRFEVEAVEAVYGDDCHVINGFPPHLTVHIKPRTADDSSQQYPKKPPYIYIVEMKGLDENRQAYLISGINNKAQELSSCLMLVSLCEEAVEVLSILNHPDGDCPLCLYPLVAEDKSGVAVPFMKLMSCYHCFHNECIIRFWKWFQEQNKINGVKQTDRAQVVNADKANCPVCRKEFDAKDMEHVLDYLGMSSLQLNFSELEIDEEEKAFLQSASENNRREKFESVLKAQQENGGLIEPKKNLAILPGMYLPESVAKPSISTETNDELGENGVSSVETEVKSQKKLNEANTSKQRNPNSRRKNRFYDSKRAVPVPPNRSTQWVRKEL